MAKFKYMDIEMAFEFVNFQGTLDKAAVLNLNNGKIYYHSDLEEDEIPEEAENGAEGYVWIPEKQDLDLGSKLVFDFVRKEIPNEYPVVEKFFSKKGAYSKFKKFLENINLLERWYEYENSQTRKALYDWAKQNNVEIEPEE